MDEDDFDIYGDLDNFENHESTKKRKQDFEVDQYSNKLIKKEFNEKNLSQNYNKKDFENFINKNNDKNYYHLKYDNKSKKDENLKEKYTSKKYNESKYKTFHSNSVDLNKHKSSQNIDNYKINCEKQTNTKENYNHRKEKKEKPYKDKEKSYKEKEKSCNEKEKLSSENKESSSLENSSDKKYNSHLTKFQETNYGLKYGETINKNYKNVDLNELVILEDKYYLLEKDHLESKKINENNFKKIKELEKKVDVLKNNISSLYKTAKAEIDRKNSQIKELQTQVDNLIFRRNKRIDENR